MQTNLGLNRKRGYSLVVFFGAIFVVIITNRLAALLPRSFLVLTFGLASFVLLAAVFPVIYKRKIWVYPGLIVAGIPVGIFLDVVWDLKINSIDRNLFPIEIVIWWVMSVIPIIIGSIVGHRIIQRRA